MIHHGDCLDVMAQMEPESVDAIVTDPPYNLVSIGKRFGKEGSAPVKDEAFGGRYGRLARGFMGKEWDGDGIAFRPEVWEAAYRVAKPSAYLLAFGGTRTVHRMTVALEDAGWIIRDMLVWGYASGFPKSKASLKPAWEPIVMARKPGPLRELAIDLCRIPSGEPWAVQAASDFAGDGGWGDAPRESHPAGRWPANIILTDPIFDGGIEGVVGGGEAGGGYGRAGGNVEHAAFGGGMTNRGNEFGYGDSGTYSRFFILPKADRADREPVLGGLPVRETRAYGDRAQGPLPQQTPQAAIRRQNVHPTVKPTELMRHLVRLVTPAGGTVLDPFLGSGTTGLACELEGFPWVGIEREAEYVAIAEARLNGTQKGMGLAV